MSDLVPLFSVIPALQDWAGVNLLTELETAQQELQVLKDQEAKRSRNEIKVTGPSGVPIYAIMQVGDIEGFERTIQGDHGGERKIPMGARIKWPFGGAGRDNDGHFLSPKILRKCQAVDYNSCEFHYDGYVYSFGEHGEHFKGGNDPSFPDDTAEQRGEELPYVLNLGGSDGRPDVEVWSICTNLRPEDYMESEMKPSEYPAYAEIEFELFEIELEDSGADD